MQDCSSIFLHPFSEQFWGFSLVFFINSQWQSFLSIYCNKKILDFDLALSEQRGTRPETRPLHVLLRSLNHSRSEQFFCTQITFQIWVLMDLTLALPESKFKIWQCQFGVEWETWARLGYDFYFLKMKGKRMEGEPQIYWLSFKTNLLCINTFTVCQLLLSISLPK